MEIQQERLVYQAVIDGELEIDSEGRVWRVLVRRGSGKGMTRIIPCIRHRAEILRSKYLTIGVMWNRKKRYALAHRLVFHHFFGPIPKCLTINHVNGDKADNRPSNLELATYSEQRIHAVRVLGCKVLSGENAWNAKLNWSKVRLMRQLHKEGWTFTALATRFGVCLQSASDVCNERSWRGMEAIK